MAAKDVQKALIWVGTSKKDLLKLPKRVQDSFGWALGRAQMNTKCHYANPLKGFGGAGVLEIVENHKGNTYRAVYTVKLAHAIYVLHVFQKKSNRGIKTPKTDIELIKKRLKRALEDYDGKK